MTLATQCMKLHKSTLLSRPHYARQHSSNSTLSFLYTSHTLHYKLRKLLPTSSSLHCMYKLSSQSTQMGLHTQYSQTHFQEHTLHNRCGMGCKTKGQTLMRNTLPHTHTKCLTAQSWQLYMKYSLFECCLYKWHSQGGKVHTHRCFHSSCLDKLSHR